MYGLLIENISQYIQARYSIEKWNDIRRLAQIEETAFSVHKTYPDVYTKNIINKACQVLKLTEKQLLIEIGESFVSFIGRYGYDVILSALGREFSDFLNNLDDLHEYLRLSYPRLRPPSYFCENENELGLILHYRTKRNFLLWYTVGQIITVAKVFYNTDVKVELLTENQEINEYHFVLQVRFDNRGFRYRLQAASRLSSHSRASQRISPSSPLFNQAASLFGCPMVGNNLGTASGHNSPSLWRTNGSDSRTDSPAYSLPSRSPLSMENGSQLSGYSNHEPKGLSPIPADVFLNIFPFSIIFDHTMAIKHTGSCLKIVCPNVVNENMPKVFTLIKPRIEFSWDSILRHTNTTFELRLEILLKTNNKSNQLLTRFAVRNANSAGSTSSSGSRRGTPPPGTKPWEDCVASTKDLDESPKEDTSHFLQLKGQMLYFDHWKSIAFLGAPIVDSLDTLIKTGLYLNDLSMHDFSRDMVLVGQQQSAELKMALDQELHKSRQLEITIKKLDEERIKSDDLLYQMIPKKIADKLRQSEKNIETCQYFPSITILFSDIINFTEICSKIAPMQVVNMLNETYTKFDQLTEKHNIYKVETIGDAYMVAGGLPVHQEESNQAHARQVCLMAMDMIAAVYHIIDPSSGRHLKIRIGVHTGPVVGGIVGQKMPRYCLFGDTVNTSSRMETSSQKMRVQISESTHRLLDLNEWDVRERGTIRLKGKGLMKTYWLSQFKGSKRKVSSAVSSKENSIAQVNNTNNNPDGKRESNDKDRGEDGRTLFPLRQHNNVHDSNCSLLVRNKFSCNIL